MLFRRELKGLACLALWFFTGLTAITDSTAVETSLRPQHRLKAVHLD